MSSITIESAMGTQQSAPGWARARAVWSLWNPIPAEQRGQKMSQNSTIKRKNWNEKNQVKGNWTGERKGWVQIKTNWVGVFWGGFIKTFFVYKKQWEQAWMGKLVCLWGHNYCGGGEGVKVEGSQCLHRCALWGRACANWRRCVWHCNGCVVDGPLSDSRV